MRILHITSDWKWTGPAEPMLLTVSALRERGHTVDVACPDPPSDSGLGIAGHARARGIEPTLRLERARGARWRRDASDAQKLEALVDERDVEVVHAWHTRAHALSLRALRARRRAGRTALVRSHASGNPVRWSPWSRWIYGPGCDGLWCVSPRAAEQLARLRGGRPCAGRLGAVDAERFGAADGGAVRAKLGISPQAAVIGVVARVQRHRRFELLFEALAKLGALHPEARLLVIGRGTHFGEVARQPIERLGLGERVVLAGYRESDYAECIAATDVLTYLVPGSDGTCRAVLEAAAAGVPAVASRRGALPEIVLDGQTGVLVTEDAEAISRAWAQLLDDPELRQRLGAAARRRARTEFVPASLGADVERLYVASSGSSAAARSPDNATSSR